MKIFKTLLFSTFIALTACSKSPADKVISFYEETAHKIEKAESASEFIEISRNFLINFNELDSDPDIRNYKPTAKDEEKIQKAEERLGKAVKDAESRFNVNLDSLW